MEISNETYGLSWLELNMIVIRGNKGREHVLGFCFQISSIESEGVPILELLLIFILEKHVLEN